MDGENNGKPYEQMDDLGGNTTIFWNTYIHLQKNIGVSSFLIGWAKPPKSTEGFLGDPSHWESVGKTR